MSKFSKRMKKAMKAHDLKLSKVDPKDFMGFPATRTWGFGKTETVDHTTPTPWFEEDDQFDLDQMLACAAGLLDVENGQPNEEYARGICELIGRLRLDYAGKGDGTAENALLVADALDVDDLYSKRASFVRSPNKAKSAVWPTIDHLSFEDQVKVIRGCLGSVRNTPEFMAWAKEHKGKFTFDSLDVMFVSEPNKVEPDIAHWLHELERNMDALRPDIKAMKDKIAELEVSAEAHKRLLTTHAGYFMKTGFNG